MFATGGNAGAYVARLGADGTGVWTFRSGGSATTARSVAARGASFAVAGLSNGSGDFDPGSSEDVVSGLKVLFLSRFSF